MWSKFTHVHLTASGHISACTTFTYERVHKNHLKMVKGCRIDTGPYKKALSKKDPPKTLGKRVSCKTDTGLSGQRARQT